MVAGHGTPDHPRDGYAEVRALVRLQDNIPIPSGTAFEVTPNLVDIAASAHVTEAATLHGAPDLPFSEDWQKSVCNFRLLRNEIGAEHS
jgi:predicted ATP-grasp superfamily ATP-dependent carboligase